MQPDTKALYCKIRLQYPNTKYDTIQNKPRIDVYLNWQVREQQHYGQSCTSPLVSSLKLPSSRALVLQFLFFFFSANSMTLQNFIIEIK